MYIKIILFKLKSCVKFIITSKKNNLNIKGIRAINACLIC